MPSIRLTAVAAVATLALAVPATASAKDEAATAAAVGAAPSVPALGGCSPSQASVQELATLQQQIKDANARRDFRTVDELTARSQLLMMKIHDLNERCTRAISMATNGLANTKQIQAAIIGAQPAAAPATGKDEAATAAAIGAKPAASTLPTSQLLAAHQQVLDATQAKLGTLAQNFKTLNTQIATANATGDTSTAKRLSGQAAVDMIALQHLVDQHNQQVNLVSNVMNKFQTSKDKIIGNMP